MLKVNEIFYSIQGEASFAGRPCVFVRLTGCNLRCAYCDTRYAYYDGIDMSIPDILDRVGRYNCSLVEITGGEPLVQAETPALITDLLQENFQVLMETNGSLDISAIDERCIRIIDIKCPSSGEHEKNDFQNLSRITPRDEFKFVIGNRDDYEFARSVLERIQRHGSGKNPVHMSPVYGTMAPEELAEWILEDHLTVSLGLQLHKVIWGPERRGV